MNGEKDYYQRGIAFDIPDSTGRKLPYTYLFMKPIYNFDSTRLFVLNEQDQPFFTITIRQLQGLSCAFLGMKVAEAAEKLGIPYRSLRNSMTDLRRENADFPQLRSNTSSLVFSALRTRLLTLEGDNSLICEGLVQMSENIQYDDRVDGKYHSQLKEFYTKSSKRYILLKESKHNTYAH